MSRRTIILTGGGSGGHITPLLAVATELKKLSPHDHIVYIGNTGDKLADIPKEHPAIDEVYSVRAGKFRRYHGEGWKQILDIATLLKNMRDAVYVCIGFWQSRALLKRLQPSVIFVKGGFVGVPVGLAAASQHVPFITHDSDAIPGLANRLIARWATIHAVAMPEELYDYPASKTITTGIPLQYDFVPVTVPLKNKYRQDIDVPLHARMLFIIGGGLGSQRVNRAVADVVPHILLEFPDLIIVHGVGRANEAEMHDRYAHDLTPDQMKRVRVYGYLNDVYRYSGAADIIVTRAGATNLAEFATQGKACIVIPSPFLTGGHQLKNAQYLANIKAAVVIDEAALLADSNRLARQVSDLFKNPEQRAALGARLATFAKPHATRDIANIIMDQLRK